MKERLERLASGAAHDEILRDLPQLELEALVAALALGFAIVHHDGAKYSAFYPASWIAKMPDDPRRPSRRPVTYLPEHL